MTRFDICFPADTFWSIAAVFIFSSAGEQQILGNSRLENMFIEVGSLPSVAIFLAPGNRTRFISLLSGAQREARYRRVPDSQSATRSWLISSVLHGFLFLNHDSVFVHLRCLRARPDSRGSGSGSGSRGKGSRKCSARSAIWRTATQQHDSRTRQQYQKTSQRDRRTLRPEHLKPTEHNKILDPKRNLRGTQG